MGQGFKTGKSQKSERLINIKRQILQKEPFH